MKGIIRLDVPDWQIGEQVTVFFKDTMMKKGVCEYEMNTEQVIWNFLMNSINNVYGVAGLMGNLFAESRLDPTCIYPKAPNYIDRLKKDDISKEEFGRDGIAFGLAQWRFYTRKEALWDMAVAEDIPVSNLKLQLLFLINELEKHYKTVWNVLCTANNVKEASDIVMLRYEKPANVSEAAKEKRAEYGQNFLTKYQEGAYSNMSDERYFVTTAPRVNVRTGNGKNFGVLLQIGIEGTKLKYVSKADNNWIAVVTPSGKNVGWIDGTYLNEV